MIYLEDYLESIEHLPREIKEKFLEMGDLDKIAYGNNVKQRRVMKEFFTRAPSMSREEREEEFRKLKSKYQEALNCTTRKTQLAQTMYDTVDRYLRKLDAELQKLKMELEADSPGITEVLEQRALEMDTREVVRDGDKKLGPDGQVLADPGSQGITPMMGAGGTALAAAASQAIAATQQMPQGRRSASLKASYEAITGLQDLGADVGVTFTGTVATDGGRKNKRKGQTAAIPSEAPPSPSAPSAEIAPALFGADGVVPDWAIDPNEPRYCVCNQVSYGDMVACDNEECPYEWFHYACVGMTDAPKGKWYCPRCLTTMKRRGTKK